MEVRHVVAASDNNVIGINGKMPWRIPGELQVFKRLTLGKALIIGRKTHESIGRLLPGRETIIVTRDASYRVEGARTASSIPEAIAIAKELGLDAAIGGGGEIYRQSLALADRIFVSRVHRRFEGDTFYPEIDPAVFEEVSREDVDAEIPYTVIEYRRRSNAV